MSDCCNNPGVGNKAEDLEPPKYDAYNPSEVRLYGRPAVSQSIFTAEELRGLDGELEAELKNPQIKAEDRRQISAIIRRVAEAKLLNLFQQQIVLAIIDEKASEVSRLPVEINIPSRNFRRDDERYIKSIGVIYGYAYEGHCYKLPKPQIMYLPEEPREILGGDCGCDCGYVPELGYAVWQIDKLERVIALDVRSDDVKTLVLDENMPGSRSPMAYAQTMALAPQRHRD
ncbi:MULTISPECIES: hypothetical protein [unclassified Sinorhizobium]|uniref:hypothetical protein n=1 Tax=unclassified Sinorhizobium TaxID=2613772 RepID=UPI0024C34A57|nr:MULTISPECIES: hypothetical protein [unclassified Sinorhizobium]MDK1378378.1 hypothetical protein [Sinorhizobium sp. 6-70]MDK1482075.1 hypothetical protein [Sinorhizobium sp. 6-117]